MKLYYCKQCHLCKEVFYKKEIDEDTFGMLQENPNTRIEYTGVTAAFATIQSRCSICEV